ncbi:hypothetical protein GSI_03031 [Ganoderma sinense ZZ0214-1]|uniref:Uncharacterized protein n=1 Tax=Ganoderma sinense ZZ0214-1 TaxID=1077348 RepID=A0A2G8SNA4_9APHY|nr:hypothetical protein GSI_03031 [Ganoderma sinense ZZ0214-1]
MAHVLATFRRPLRSLHLPRLTIQYPPPSTLRSIHATTAVSKRNQQLSASTADSADLFGDVIGSSGSLFSDDPSPANPSPPISNSAPNVDIPPHNPSVPSPRHYDRNARFNHIYGFARACLVTKSESKRQVRSSVWNHLFQLASTPEQLDRVAELFPSWRDAQRPFRPSTVVAFALRCNALRCPGLAVKVFSNRPKYGFDLSLDAAQIILHSLHRWQRHKDIITFTTLYSIYNLPPVASDLVSNALLLKALFRNPTNPSAAMAQAMLPLFQRTLERTDPLSMTIQQNDPRLSNRKKTWLASALKRIEGVLEAQQVEHGWLTRWMHDSGHASATASL